MRFKAIYRYARVSPRKARDVAALLPGRHVDDALQILRAVRRRASYLIDKVLRSAIASADESLEADMDSLLVVEARVDKGPVRRMKWLPRARGMVTPLRRRTSHITIVLDDGRE